MAQNENRENYDPSKDPIRKAKSNDPGWKYGFWPDLGNKDVVECSLCHRQVHSGIKRLKQHLVGNYGDVVKCPKTTEKIRKEMHEFMNKKLINRAPRTTEFDYFEDNQEVEEHGEQQCMGATQSSQSSVPSSVKSIKRKHSQSILKFVEPSRVGKQSKSVASMFRKTPEEVVEERHKGGCVQKTIEASTKSKDVKEVHRHIANFFYECNIPFNAVNSRSFEVMVEAIGQFGPGLKPPSSHELQVLLLEDALKEKNKNKLKKGT